MKIQAWNFARERSVPSTSLRPAEILKHVTLLYTLVEADVQNKVKLLRNGEGDWIGVGGQKESERDNHGEMFWWGKRK